MLIYLIEMGLEVRICSLLIAQYQLKFVLRKLNSPILKIFLLNFSVFNDFSIIFQFFSAFHKNSCIFNYMGIVHEKAMITYWRSLKV